MFADRFDALMNIAEVSNSQLGRSVNLNPSHIGRLRNGARPLPKNHEYLPAMCRYLAERITKDYQITALQKLTGIGNIALASPNDTARYLEQWLVGQERNASAAAGRFISGLSRYIPTASPLPTDGTAPMQEVSTKYAEYLFGNAGKRKAVEQFFLMVLQEEKPQTLLLFSDENMAWLYEDAAFAAQWAELFARVIRKGNRVRIIHTVSRDLNEMLEALMKWIPLYMTGMIEPYCYPRLRDGVYQRTLFIAPRTAAIVSSSVQQNTDGMLNIFLTNRAALDALEMEYERYFALCRPLMRIFPECDARAFHEAAKNLIAAPGDAYLCCATPPIFAMPESLVRDLAEQAGNEELRTRWERSRTLFKRCMLEQRLSIAILNPERFLSPCTAQRDPVEGVSTGGNVIYTAEQYAMHVDHLKRMERTCGNLTVSYVDELERSAILYLKEDTGAFVAKANAPKTAFFVTDANMMSAFHDYLEKFMLSPRSSSIA